MRGLRRRQQFGPFAEPRFQARIDRRLWSQFDWALLGLTGALCAAGILNLYSGTYGGIYENLYYVQLASLGLGVGGLLVAFLVPYRFFEATSYLLYLGAIALLVAVLGAGSVSHGARRWLSLGHFTFQPSELSKIALAMVLARYFSANPNYSGYGPRELILPALLTLVPVGLILLQPDLGTALIHVLIFVTVALFMRVKPGTLWLTALLGVLVAPAGWFFVLKDYQKARILTLFDPDRDPLGSGYHIRQSIIAVGSGRWLGKGFLKGTQTKLQFLPEHHTDFIFSVYAEEWGLVGCLVLLAVYFSLLVKGAAISVASKDRYGSILAAGLTACLFWHVVINLLMVVGLAPVVGVTLPFFSYGRTSLISMLLIVGLLMNVSSRRYMFEQ